MAPSPLMTRILPLPPTAGGGESALALDESRAICALGRSGTIPRLHYIDYSMLNYQLQISSMHASHRQLGHGAAIIPANSAPAEIA